MKFCLGAVVLDRLQEKADDLREIYSKKVRKMCDPISAIVIGGALGIGAASVKNADKAQKAQAKVQKQIIAQNTKQTQNAARVASQDTISARQKSYDTRRRTMSGTASTAGLTGMTSSRSFFSAV